MAQAAPRGKARRWKTSPSRAMIARERRNPRAMESIGILGLSFHDHDAATLARATVPRPDRVRRLPELAAALGVRELLYVATCNRVELLYRRSGGGAEDLRQ